MSGFIINRMVQAVFVLLILTFLVFSLLRLVPGDPIAQILGPHADRESMEQLREQLGFNQSVPQQYGTWLGKLARGDMGQSVITRQPVTDTLRSRIPVTLQITLGAWVIAILIGVTSGIAAALMRNRWPDYALSVFTICGIAMPSFWLAIILMLILSVRLGWLPTSGYVSPTTDLAQSVKLSIMPWFVAGFGSSAVLMRQTRSALLEVLRQDYVRTAWAKGLTQRVVIVRHALKNGMIPVLTIAGLALGNLLAGEIIVEMVYGLPGMGRLLIESLLNHDYPVIQGIVLVVGVCVALANLLVDIAYGWLDPRVKYA